MATSFQGSSSLGGHLLCAVPQLQDPNFHRSVVFLLDHGEDGALGLVLNAEAENTMMDVATALGIHWGGDELDLARVGGPCEPARGFILHDDPEMDPEGREVLPGLWLTTSLATLEGAPRARKVDGTLVLGLPGHQIVFLLGYAGWGPGQLEAELAAGSWVPVPVVAAASRQLGVSTAFVLSAQPATMWSEALGALGVDPARLVGLSGGTASLH